MTDASTTVTGTVAHTFVQRAITVTFKLADGSLGPNGVTLTGLRVSVDLERMGQFQQGAADIRIYGMPFALMSQLSTLGKLPAAYNLGNTVTVSAGRVGGTMTTIFHGKLVQAWIDADAQPEVAFQIVSTSALDYKMLPITPTNFKGAANVSTIMQAIATKVGVGFSNNGVTTQISNQYLKGSAGNQIDTLARACGFLYSLDADQIAIWPPNDSRSGAVSSITAGQNLINYPSYNAAGLDVRAIWNPEFVYGGQVQITSSLKQATGTFVIIGLAYALESETPDGKWEVKLTCCTQGFFTMAQMGTAS